MTPTAAQWQARYIGKSAADVNIVICLRSFNAVGHAYTIETLSASNTVFQSIRAASRSCVQQLSPGADIGKKLLKSCFCVCNKSEGLPPQRSWWCIPQQSEMEFGAQ